MIHLEHFQPGTEVEVELVRILVGKVTSLQRTSMSRIKEAAATVDRARARRCPR
jgi:hypothetical protein